MASDNRMSGEAPLRQGCRGAVRSSGIIWSIVPMSGPEAVKITVLGTSIFYDNGTKRTVIGRSPVTISTSIQVSISSFSSKA
jgi:hypothetical protein